MRTNGCSRTFHNNRKSSTFVTPVHVVFNCHAAYRKVACLGHFCFPYTALSSAASLIISRESRTHFPEYFQINNVLTKDKTLIANAFNAYFANVGSNLASKMKNNHNTAVIFPDKLKCAKVIPIYKKGDNTKLDHYRHISILPTISKNLERVIFDQLYDHFHQNNLLYSSQYGFKKKHSTEWG